jgi:hypothetical protein
MRWVCLALIGWASVSGAFAETPAAQTTVIWIVLGNRIQLKKVAPGATLEGVLERAVYWRETEVFPIGSKVRMVVGQIESRKKTYAVDDRPFVIHLFAPRHDRVARFRSVKVLMPGGEEIPLRATFIALSQRAQLKARTGKTATAATNASADTGGKATKSPQSKMPLPWVLTLQVEPEASTLQALAEARAGNGTGTSACPEPCTIAEGTRMPAVLLGGLSASKDHNGQTFQAMLLEPVLTDSKVAIPQGTIVQGVLAKRVPPRRLYRPASVSLLFTRLVLPSGATTAIAASPVAVEVDRGTHMTMDSEGRIHAQHPGKARFLLDFGVTGGISKVSDDTTQLIIEAISSTATDASTAGVARFAAMGASAIYLLTRHGRDVILPPFTEMDLSLTRSISLASGSTAAQPAD